MSLFLFDLAHSPNTTVFWLSAVGGTMLFLLRMLTTFMGAAFDADDIDHHMFDSADDGHHNDPSFKLFTLHSLSGFLMMFGWIGLASTCQLHLAYPYALLAAMTAGISMMLVTALTMRIALRLEGPGTVFTSKKAVGHIGTVYQRIPEHGQGKIHVVVDNITRELLAQSHDQLAIESFTLVKVVKALDHEIVEVITSAAHAESSAHTAANNQQEGSR